MKQKIKSALSLFMLLTVLLSLGTSASAAVSTSELNHAIEDTATFMYKTVAKPQVGSIGGEWAVLGLARSGYSVPDQYYQDYYATVEEYVTACNGILHNKKYTEYSRLIVALTAIGKDPGNVAGYNLLTPLGDYDKTIWQGLNGPIWALIALDSGNYAVPVNKAAATQATRQMYIDRILTCQLSDGGWSLFGGTAHETGNEKSDPDITGMALQALAKYQDQPAVAKATKEALECMSKQQNSDGGYFSWGSLNSESCVQILVALAELEIPLDDARFVKNGNTLLDNLMTYYLPGKGFLHTQDGTGSNQMASEQAFYGLIAAQRLRDGKSSLYRMGDALKIEAAAPSESIGLPGKHVDVKKTPITLPGATFSDISGVNAHKNQTAIEALAARGILSGKTSSVFDPDATMTRAEFATTVVRALGLAPKANSTFADVKSGDWFAPYVGTANRYGIVSGISATMFQPQGTITRQEAAAMVARAGKLCGMDTTYDVSTARDVLAQFTDYVKCADWASASLAFCYEQEILDSSSMTIAPRETILRCEIAQMLYQLLGRAQLL